MFFLFFFFSSRNTFSKAGSMILKISSIWAWNVSYKFWFTPSPKNGYLLCAQICLFCFVLFFQISSKLNLFSCRDGVYSLSMIFVCLFWCKKKLNSVAFVIFFNTLTITFLLKHCSIKKNRNFSSYVCWCQSGNVS